MCILEESASKEPLLGLHWVKQGEEWKEDSPAGIGRTGGQARTITREETAECFKLEQ